MPSSELIDATVSWLSRHDYAHRGLHDRRRGCPENSLAAFEAAIAAGFGIELDVRASSDGEAIVFHDDTLFRLTGIHGTVRSVTAAELGKIRLKGAAETIPTLDTVLALVKSRAPILIELKREGASAALERAVAAALVGYRGLVAVMSFEPQSIAWFAEHAPNHWRGHVTKQWPPRLLSGKATLDRWRRLVALAPGRPHFFACDIRTLQQRFHPAGFPFPLLTWTVQREAQRERAKSLGAAIIFERLRP
ncbi:MAG: glycerophosphodiester phosphodiesterase [Alphaproteobacteria bacterium]|nr:glycerophosphodiester phosphodiesterase [Alphaproteobacteria bacterium]